MAITSAVCDSFKSEILQGIHAAGDTYNIALFTSAAALDKTTTAYNSTNEVSGTGYTAGGQALSGIAFGLSGDAAYMNWTTNPAWSASTFSAAGALIYNASKSNRAVAVISFGGNVSVAGGSFTINMPGNGATSVVTLD